MSVEEIRNYFEQYEIKDRIIEFNESSATVDLAAAALNCDPGMIAKSITFMVDDKAVIIVASGDTKIDNAKYKAQFGVKAKMLTPQEVIDLVGYSVGSVCPFLVKEEVSVYLDESLRRYDAVFPSAGSCNSVMKLTLEELEKHSNSISWVDVCKGW